MSSLDGNLRCQYPDKSESRDKLLVKLRKVLQTSDTLMGLPSATKGPVHIKHGGVDNRTNGCYRSPNLVNSCEPACLTRITICLRYSDTGPILSYWRV